jgi:predicted DNA-binding transcriptional regulator AlpA
MATLPTTPTRFLNEKELSAILTVSVATLRRWRLLGQGPRATKIGAAVRYKPADIEAFLSRCPTIGGPERGR